MLKFIRVSLIAGLSIFLISGIVLNTDTVHSWIKSTIIQKVQTQSGLKLSFDELTLYPTFRASLTNVKVQTEDGVFFHAENLLIGLNPLELLHKKIHLYKVEIFNGSGSFFKNPIAISGSLTVPLNNGTLTAALAIPSYETKAELIYKEGAGTIQAGRDLNHFALLNFKIEERRILIPNFKGKWESLSAEGDLAILYDGAIENSHFTLTADHVLQGSSLYGKGKLSGHITSPQMDAYLECPEIMFGKLLFETPSLHFVTTHSENGLAGSATFSFYKEGELHRFSGALNWEQGDIKNPSNFLIRTSLNELCQIMEIDQADIQGEILAQLHFNKNGLSANAELINASFASYDFGFSFSSINATFEGTPKEISLTKFTARDPQGGLYEGKGMFVLDAEDRFPFSLELKIKEGELMHLENIGGSFDGKLFFSGNTQEGLLKGNLKALKASVQIPEKTRERAEVIEVTYINQPAGIPEPMQANHKKESWPLNLDININLPKNGSITGKNLTSDWKGKVAITGTPAKLKTKGEFKLSEGKYVFRGKSVKLKEGTILMNGDPLKQTTLYLHGELDLGEIDVHAVLKGPVLNSNITLTSTPPLPQRAILSWLLFNKGVGEINPMEETQLSRSLRSLSEQTDDKPDLLTRVGGILGIDHLEISGGTQNGDKGDVTLKVGKYLTEDTFISISSSLSQDENGSDRSNCVGLEKQFGKHVRFRAEADSESNGRLNLLWRKDY